MRLIDADKLEKDIVENITVKAVSRMLAIIQGQPTVKAITIEWLREYCKYNHTPDGMDWHKAVDLIIKRWEKENADR